ncbi:hypothetical protein [Labrenzia sp. PHM005]|uniref:hypothetical protein n=1 Tax=Labrenzia sp. PHM005 TaxID=2590016 RepID=UPI00113FCBF3|nr:hypothetical protein [Labrenzia sp. PHM005]QDG74433.1 hypothetical protein FJ695_00280 [Labrenzia sp. PHM005]
MTPKTTPLTYLEQATLIGFLALGEDYPFIAEVLDRPVGDLRSVAAEIARTQQLAAVVSNTVVTSPAKTPKAQAVLPEPPPEKPKPKWRPRRFRMLPIASRQAPRGTYDVTAALMGDPPAAAFERSLAKPAEIRPGRHSGKWS